MIDLHEENTSFGEQETGETVISLSGGGYRAMLFHLGFLWRMRDAGILGRVDRFASVSGGSIVAGMLAKHWSGIDWADEGQSFRKLVGEPVIQMSQQSIDVAAGLIGRVPGMNGSWVRRAYDRVLFGGTKLTDLLERPRFIFNATSLHSGKLVRMERRWIADYTVGHWDSTGVSLAQAVAASSAFPPVLSPVTVDLKGRRFTRFPDARHPPPPKLYLTDGGVYDNLGIESVWKQAGTVYVSDAGANFQYESKGTFLLSSQALRVTFIMQDQIGALRFRQILNAFETTDSEVHRNGFLVSSDFFVDPRPMGGPSYERGLVEDLAATPTRLSRVDEIRAMRLVNWGYAATDDRIRSQGLPAGRCELPYSRALLG